MTIISLYQHASCAHQGTLHYGQWRAPCLLGKGGITRWKKEGDGAFPCGIFPLRSILWRRDRLGLLHTSL
ncbi:MAG: hypothetical protein GDA54_05755, partial [Alphaproteobacteria bacterium GM7ARS4]|nr:hypothetical protein [Alphaproteobacteria bacterium GM7ARS4]